MPYLNNWRWAPTLSLVSAPLPSGEIRRSLGVVVVAFAIKLGLGGIWLDIASGDTWNGYEVVHIAENLAAGYGFTISPTADVYLPTAWISPLYPLLLAVILKAFGSYTPAAAVAVLFANCLFQALSAGLLYLLGLRLCGRLVALSAAGIFLINPNGWQFLDWAWPSHLFALLVLAHVYALLTPVRQARRAGGMVGITFALALMADGAAIAVAPITLAHLILSRDGSERRTALASALVCFAIVVAPWTLRNAHHFGTLNPLRGNVGINLWVGNYPGANAESFHGLLPSPWHDQRESKRFMVLGEHAYDRAARKRALDEISSDPERFITNTLTRFSGFWIGEWWAGYRHIAWFYSLGLISLSALALRGAFRARTLGTGLLLAAILLFGSPYYLTVHGHGRYRVPIEPLMCLLAALRLGEEREGVSGGIE